MVFEFWLIDEKNNINLLLPVTPASYSADKGNTIEVVNATELGDINITGHRKLSTIRIESFFTVQAYPFVNQVTYPVSHPMDYIKLIDRWIEEKSLIRFVVASLGVTRMNSLFYIENINYSENQKSNGDIDYVLDLKEYRAMNTPKITTQTATTMADNTPRVDATTPLVKSTYTVVSGDSLSKIARKMYGDANQWKKIYEANKGTIGSNPNLIYPGQVYTIP